MKYSYRTRGTCSTRIDLDIEDGIIRDVSFTSGCNGNLKAISLLVKGMRAEDVVGKLRGLGCDNRGTSCGDQLARAIEEAALVQTKFVESEKTD